MIEDALKLTTYFGELHRAEHGLVADALLDLYGQHAVHASVLLRGVEGFGLKHHLSTDRLESLSYDLPLVSVAVDTRARIDAILPHVIAIKRHGLITLERARMLTGAIGPVALPEDPHEQTKLTIYVGRQEKIVNTPAFITICDLLYRRGIAGATVLLGVDGTFHGQRERARFFGRNANVPLMIIAVGAGDKIAHVLPELAGLVRNPLMTLERVRVCKRDGELLERPHAALTVDEHGLATWQKLMIYNSEQAKHHGTNVHVALTLALRKTGARGATTLRGIWGFHGDHTPHGDRLLQIRRYVPVITIIIDSPEQITRSFDIVDEMTNKRGLVTSELVPAVAALENGATTRGGLRLAKRQPRGH